MAPVGHPHFRSVDAIHRAVARRRGRMFCRSVPASGSDRQIPPRRSPARAPAGIVVFCSSVPIADQHVAQHQMRTDDPGEPEPSARKLREDPREGDVIDLGATEFLGDVEAEQADFRHLSGESVRILAACSIAQRRESPRARRIHGPNARIRRCSSRHRSESTL